MAVSEACSHPNTYSQIQIMPVDKWVWKAIVSWSALTNVERLLKRVNVVMLEKLLFLAQVSTKCRLMIN